MDMTWHPLGARVGSRDEGTVNSSIGLLRKEREGGRMERERQRQRERQTDRDRDREERERRERGNKCKRVKRPVTNLSLTYVTTSPAGNRQRLGEEYPCFHS